MEGKIKKKTVNRTLKTTWYASQIQYVCYIPKLTQASGPVKKQRHTHSRKELSVFSTLLLLQKLFKFCRCNTNNLFLGCQGCLPTVACAKHSDLNFQICSKTPHLLVQSNQFCNLWKKSKAFHFLNKKISPFMRYEKCENFQCFFQGTQVSEPLWITAKLILRLQEKSRVFNF